MSIDKIIIRFTGRSKYIFRIKGKPTPIRYYILALYKARYLQSFLFYSPKVRYKISNILAQKVDVFAEEDLTPIEAKVLVIKKQKVADKAIQKATKEPIEEDIVKEEVIDKDNILRAR